MFSQNAIEVTESITWPRTRSGLSESRNRIISYGCIRLDIDALGSPRVRLMLLTRIGLETSRFIPFPGLRCSVKTEVKSYAN